MKHLLPLLTAMLCSLGMSASALPSIPEGGNLTPYWDFTQLKQSAPLKASAAAGNGGGIFNLGGSGGNWYANNKNNYDFSNGLLVAGSSLTMPAHLQSLNNSFQFVDLGGECGNVWCFNYSNSNLSSALRKYGFRVNLSGGTANAGVAANQYHLYFIPSPSLYADSPKLRCRVELNVYHAEGENTPTLHIYGQVDAGNDIVSSCKPIAADKWSTAAEYAITPDYFRDENGAWDPTKWMVYDFPVSDATPANHPVIKFRIQDKGLHDHALLIRSISFYVDETGTAGTVTTDILNHFASYSIEAPAVELPFNALPSATEIAGSDNFVPALDFNVTSALPAVCFGDRPYQVDNFGVLKPAVADRSNGIVAISLAGQHWGVVKVDGDVNKAYKSDEQIAPLLEGYASGFQKLDLGGDCGPVLVMNNANSNLESQLANVVEEGTYVAKGTATTFDGSTILSIISPEREALPKGTKVCRIEYNIYDPSFNATFTAVGRENGTKTVGDKGSNPVVKSDVFQDENGNWDPSKWVVYEYAIPDADPDNNLLHGTDNLYTLATLANFKANCALLIRSVNIYLPDDQQYASTIAPMGKTYEVGTFEHPIQPVADENGDNAKVFEMMKNNETLIQGHAVALTAPAWYDLYVRISHSGDCNHPEHAARGVAARSANNYTDDYVPVDGNEFVYYAPLQGHTENFSIKAVNRASSKVYEHNFTVVSDATTGVEAVGSDRAEGEAVLYNLQGVKVDAATAAPGVYIERRGSAARKVVR